METLPPFPAKTEPPTPTQLVCICTLLMTAMPSSKHATTAPRLPASQFVATESLSSTCPPLMAANAPPLARLSTTPAYTAVLKAVRGGPEDTHLLTLEPETGGVRHTVRGTRREAEGILHSARLKVLGLR